MTDDNIALKGRKIEVLLGTSQSSIRMPKSMKTMARIGVVPVVEKIIVQKRATHQGVRINLHAHARKCARHANARLRHRDHMLVNRNIAMLDKRTRQSQSAIFFELQGNIAHICQGILWTKATATRRMSPLHMHLQASRHQSFRSVFVHSMQMVFYYAHSTACEHGLVRERTLRRKTRTHRCTEKSQC